jgi:TetR/AcrR family transcriptional regulator, transcriptional repressor for nem operon
METGPKRRRERRPPEVRREQILDAAALVFTEKGLSATTMDDVAVEAGVAKGTIYLYFDSKEQLLLSLGERYTEEVIQRSGSLFEGDDADESPMARFDRFLEGMIDYYIERRDLHHVLFHGGAVSEAESLRRVRELLRRFIEEGLESGEFRVTDTGFTADFLLGGLHGALVPVLHEQSPDRDRFLVPARELVRNTLGA